MTTVSGTVALPGLRSRNDQAVRYSGAVERSVAGRYMAPALGCLLAFAGGMKMSSVDSGAGGWAVGTVELVVGVWLAWAEPGRRAWRVAIVLWSVFTLVVAAKAFQGVGSCGCFGRLQVSPVWTLALDIAVLGRLLMRPWGEVRPGAGGSAGRPNRRWRAWATALVVAFFGVGLGLGSGRVGPAAWRVGMGGGFSEAGGFEKLASVVSFDASKWVGSRLPMLAEVVDGERLTEGKWIVVLHRPGCGVCAEVLATLRGSQGEDRYAAVSLEGAGGSRADLVSGAEAFGVRPGAEWYGETPVVLALEGGVVRQVAVGVAGKAWLEGRKEEFRATKPDARAIVGMVGEQGNAGGGMR